MKKEKYKIEYCGLVTYENHEESAEFMVTPHFQNNGVKFGKGIFWAIVSLPVLGIERNIDEDGLTQEEIEKARELVMGELS